VRTGGNPLEERGQAGDPRITGEGRELLLRLVSGDLVDEFQAELDAVSESDPLLGGDCFLDPVT